MNNKMFWRVYYTNQDGRTDYRDFTNKSDAIEYAKINLYAWGWEDKAVCVKEYTVKEIDFLMTI